MFAILLAQYKIPGETVFKTVPKRWISCRALLKLNRFTVLQIIMSTVLQISDKHYCPWWQCSHCDNLAFQFLCVQFCHWWQLGLCDDQSVIVYHRLFIPCHLLFAVDADEIKRLGKRFRKLDLDNSGSLSVDEFMSLPELQQNPLVQRVIDIFDTDGNGEVDFKGEWFCYFYFMCRDCLIVVMCSIPFYVICL